MHMKCEQFLESYSDFVDGLLDQSADVACEEHETRCPSCSRYARVMREGVDLFRDLPAAETASDFSPRLRHRLYHVEDNIPWAAAHPGGSAAILAVAAVGLLSLFWLPFATQIPVEVQFAPVAVDTPEDVPVASLFQPGPHLESPTVKLLPLAGTTAFAVAPARIEFTTGIRASATDSTQQGR